MIDGLKPYPARKDSGIPWLGTLPVSWKALRAKYLVREVDERSATGSEELLSVSHKTGVTPRSEKKVTMFLAESNVGHKLCRPGDVVINTMWAWMAALGVSKHKGLVSPSYGVYRPISKSNALLPKFADELLRTEIYRAEYVRRSTGINSSRLRLYPDQFLKIPLIVPPMSDQETIAKYIEHADRKISGYMRAKQKLIKLLEEERRGIIDRAVARGFDRKVRLKPSGVPWIGDVPEHWQVSRVKNEFLCLNSRRIPLSGTERGQMTSRRYDYYGASGVIDKVDDFIFDDELLLIAEDGANLVLRNLPLAIIARGKFWVNNHAHILKPKRGSIEFLSAKMEALNLLPWISGAAQPKLTQDRLMSIAIAVPPPEEQDAIMAHVLVETKCLRSAIERATNEVALLREYRARLVADVVTGKLDVREAAAKLPDISAEGGALDEAENPLQDDSMADEIEAEAQEEAA